jgi:iron-sulfur cluster assembly 1
MSARLLRLHHATRYSLMPFLYPCLATLNIPSRLAMMSAIRYQPQPPLTDSPPTVIPSSNSLVPDAAAPQIAARPPPVPKVEKPRPKIRSSKAALTIVRLRFHTSVSCSADAG